MDIFHGAHFIGSREDHSPIIYSSFITKKSCSATLYLATLGFSELYINGKNAKNDLLTPLWSDYHKRSLIGLIYPINDELSYSHYYEKFDISSFLVPGENTIAVWLGNGFYHQNRRKVEGNMDYGLPKVKLCIVLNDGEKETYKISDDTFSYKNSPIIQSNVYFGETFDGRIAYENMLLSSDCTNTIYVYPEIDSVCRYSECPTDEVIKSVTPVLIYQDNNKKVYDLGENTTGRVAIKTSCKINERVVIKFAENVDDEKQLDYNSCGGIDQIQSDVYISNGLKDQYYAPRFCIHGFRYFEVTGETDEVVGEVIYTKLLTTGDFSTSSLTINKIIAAYKNSQLTNTHYGVVSDCPHRERLGYTGDGWIAAQSACSFFEMHDFYEKWLRDIADSQCKHTGHVQHTAPFCGGGGGPGGWGGAIIFLPWIVYEQYADISILNEYYENMKSWLKYMSDHEENGIITSEEKDGWCLGDWCTPEEISISPAYVNSCLYIMQLETMCMISATLGKRDDENKFKAKLKNAREAVNNNFLNEEGSFDCNSQGSDAFAFLAGLLNKESAKKRFSRYNSMNIDTGIFGTPFLIQALIKLDMGETAIKLLEQSDYPSFGFMFENGATTLWETFDGKVSHNHPMFGAVVGTLKREITGISLPVSKRIIMNPKIIRLLKNVETITNTSFGKISFRYIIEKTHVNVNISVPKGTVAEITLFGKIYEVFGNENIVIENALEGFEQGIRSGEIK